MVRTLVGAGGWGYFGGGLRAYARAFRFVEVNATFYRHIPEAVARRWRAQVPPDFTFALRAHRDITHRERLRATVASRQALGHDLRLARLLNAPYLILETPASLPLDEEAVSGLRDLVASAGPSVRIGLEARANAAGRLPERLEAAFADLGVLDVVDLSRQAPRVAGDAVYARLFGKGTHTVYEFDDEELRDIDRNGGDAVEVALAFHGVRMYRDAARFLTFKRTGAFPPVTEALGAESLREVLRADARFPATRDALRRDHGWKLFDLDETTRVRAERVLRRLPARTYRNLEDLLGTVRDTGVASAG